MISRRALVLLAVVACAGLALAGPRTQAADVAGLDELGALHAPSAAAIEAWAAAGPPPAALAAAAAGEGALTTRAERSLAAALAARSALVDVEHGGWAAVRAAPDGEVRITAAFAEGLRRCQAGSDACLGFARQLLDDAEPRIREVAVDLLAREASPAARTLLAAHRGVEADEAVRRRIERRLARW